MNWTSPVYPMGAITDWDLRNCRTVSAALGYLPAGHNRMWCTRFFDTLLSWPVLTYFAALTFLWNRCRFFSFWFPQAWENNECP